MRQSGMQSILFINLHLNGNVQEETQCQSGMNVIHILWKL